MKVCTYCGKDQIAPYLSCCGEVHWEEIDAQEERRHIQHERMLDQGIRDAYDNEMKPLPEYVA